MRKQAHIHTRLIHAGEQPDPATGAVVPPIYQATTFAFPDNESMERLMEAGGAGGYIYTRYGNPNCTMVESKLADLEGAGAALLVSTGMAAISITAMTACRAGDHLITHRDLYGGSFGLFYEVLPRFGIEVSWVDMTRPAAVAAALRPNTRLIYLESPANPTMRVMDIGAIAGVARGHGALLAVDNTFATPINQQPLALGADVALHSCTKYLGGHSDVMAGAIAGPPDFVLRAQGLARRLGSTLNGFDAWLLLRGLKTLFLRVARQSETALQVARWLAQHPAVARVHYPGLPGHPDHDLARRQMQSSGGLLSIDLKGGGPAAAELINRVQLWIRAVSLGSVESLITQPVAAVHANVPEPIRLQEGITPAMVRLACGLEDPEDLIADLEQALAGLPV